MKSPWKEKKKKREKVQKAKERKDRSTRSSFFKLWRSNGDQINFNSKICHPQNQFQSKWLHKALWLENCQIFGASSHDEIVRWWNKRFHSHPSRAALISLPHSSSWTWNKGSKRGSISSHWGRSSWWLDKTEAVI